MTYRYTEAQQEIRDTILRICADFDDDYWLDRDANGPFPHELHKAMADGGWLGIAMPEEVGGAGAGGEGGVVELALSEDIKTNTLHLLELGANIAKNFGCGLPRLVILVHAGVPFRWGVSPLQQRLPLSSAVRANTEQMPQELLEEAPWWQLSASQQVVVIAAQMEFG